MGTCKPTILRGFFIEVSMAGPRRYTLKESYFRTWSRNMAYILGFIVADGSVADNTLRIKIQERDISVLEFIKYEVGYSGPIIHIPSGGFTQQSLKLLRLCSKNMFEDLATLGVHPAKTCNEKLPPMPFEYWYDFLRGFFDGDGCAFLEKSTRASRNYNLLYDFTSGSPEFLEELRVRTFNYGTIRKSKISNAHHWRVRHYQALDLRNLMYNGGFALQRKKDKSFMVN